MSCTHTAADMDTAAHFDGKCPVCLFEKMLINESTIKAQLDVINELKEAKHNLEVRLNAELREAAAKIKQIAP